MLGFVDVGGGTRGIYGAGVFDYCMAHGIRGDYFIGVSAGAANGASYLANQPKRNLTFYDEYAFRKEYMSLGLLLKKGSYLDLDYIYSTLSNEGGEYPVDYDAMMENPSQLEIVATDARTGKPHYFNKNDIPRNQYYTLKASCCVPVVCKPYPVEGQLYYDGGISDPIPFKRAFAAGCDKVVVVLTKPRSFYRKPGKDVRMSRLIQRKYPKAAHALATRSEVYNASLRELLAYEKAGRVLIIAPGEIGKLKTLSQDHRQLERLYDMGCRDAEAIPAFIR